MPLHVPALFPLAVASWLRRQEVQRTAALAAHNEGKTVNVARTGPSINRGESKQDYGTPPEFIHACVDRFGTLVADLAATYANRKAVEFIAPENDSLSVDWWERWPEGVLWLNPPFANIGPWAAKCAANRFRRGLILFLTPASIGTDWYAKYVHGKAVVLGLSPRLTFQGEKNPYPKDLMLSVFGYGLSGHDTWRWRWDTPTPTTGEPHE